MTKTRIIKWLTKHRFHKWVNYENGNGKLWMRKCSECSASGITSVFEGFSFVNNIPYDDSLNIHWNRF